MLRQGGLNFTIHLPDVFLHSGLGRRRDPDYGEFHLQVNSPCKNAGWYIEGLTEDFERDARDYDGYCDPRGEGLDYDIGPDAYNGGCRAGVNANPNTDAHTNS